MIKKAQAADAEILAGLAIQMWENHDPAELAEEFRDLAEKEDAACFISVNIANCIIDHRVVSFGSEGYKAIAVYLTVNEAFKNGCFADRCPFVICIRNYKGIFWYGIIICRAFLEITVFNGANVMLVLAVFFIFGARKALKSQRAVKLIIGNGGEYARNSDYRKHDRCHKGKAE